MYALLWALHLQYELCNRRFTTKMVAIGGQITGPFWQKARFGGCFVLNWHAGDRFYPRKDIQRAKTGPHARGGLYRIKC